MINPEKQSTNSEITPEQREIFVNKVREHLGPLLPRKTDISEELAEAGIDESNELDLTVDLTSEASFRVDEHIIFLYEHEIIGMPFHEIEVAEIERERIDNGFYKITYRVYKVDLYDSRPSYEEKTKVYRSKIMEFLTPVTAEPVESDSNEEVDIEQRARDLINLRDTNEALGLNIFTHEKFKEIISILDQLDEYNRYPKY
jgi:hypothetical protein